MSEGQVKLTGRLFDTRRDDREVEVSPAMARPSEHQLLWIDVGREPADLERADVALGWAGTLTALPKVASRPHIVESEEIVRVRVVGIDKDADQPSPVILDLIAAPNIIVSVHDRPIDGLGLPLHVGEAETTFGALDAPAFIALLLDGMLNGYFHAVDAIERRIDELDERALRGTHSKDMLAHLIGLRRQIATLRRALTPQREVFYSLERPRIVLGDSEEASWPLVADRFRQALEAVENARELLVGSFEIMMTRTGQRTNDVMRVLTVVSSVLLPSVVIAGVMGMNFQIGFFDDPANFIVVLAAMITLAVATLAVARWKRWI
jgi:Mg2+ and Co2+ transporter CorA